MIRHRLPLYPTVLRSHVHRNPHLPIIPLPSSSRVHRCAEEDGENGPKVLSDNDCLLELEWRTRLACSEEFQTMNCIAYDGNRRCVPRTCAHDSDDPIVIRCAGSLHACDVCI